MNRIVTLLTDFGTRDAYVGIMKGIVLARCPEARLVDLTHDIPPQDVAAGSLVLASAVDFFPPGTIHLAIIDPGVGTARLPAVVTAGAAALVGPDNGLLVPAARRLGAAQAYRITDESLLRRPVSATFHGRDIFAPVAGALAAGLAPETVGPRIAALVDPGLPEAVRSGGTIHGCVVYVDRFGNLVTNIEAAAIPEARRQGCFVRVAGRDVGPIRATYGSVPPGEPVAVVGSWARVEIAVAGGSAATRFGVGVGAVVAVEVA